MSKVICNALFEELRVPPVETRGPLETEKGFEKSADESFSFNCAGISSLLIASGETNLPVARTSITEN